MEITLIGIITALLILHAFIKGKDELTYLTIFSTVFIAAAGINITGIVGVSPFHLCGIALIIQFLYEVIKNREELIPKIKNILKENKIIHAIIIFFAVMIISVIVLLILGININYVDFWGDEQNIDFGFENIKDIVHIGFVFLVTIILTIKLDNKEKVKKAFKAFFIGGFLSLIWGMIQFELFAFRIEYPYWIFNNSISFAQLYTSVSNGMQRINSFGAEASHYAPILLAFISITVGLIISNIIKNKDNKFANAMFILAMIVGIFTTSSASYLGIAVIAIVTLIYVIVTKDIDKKKIICTFIINLVITLILVAGIYLLATFTLNHTTAAPSSGEVIEEEIVTEIETTGLWNSILDMTINKFTSQSATERSSQDKTGLEFTIENNIITGLGIGSFRTFDILTNTFVNTGIVGVLAYIYILVVVYKEIFKLRKTNKSEFILLFNLITSMTIAFVAAIPDFIFAYYWILIAISYNYCKYDYPEKKTAKREKKTKSDKVAVILLNYNGADDTKECIKSIKANEQKAEYEIIVVDNCSTDNSAEELEKIEDITFLRSKENKGFATGNNIGIKYALDNGDDYILLLNNDTEIEKNAISIMLEKYKEHKEAGIMGARIMYADNKDMINYCGGHIDLKKATAVHEHYKEQYLEEENKCKETDFITGCTMLFSKEIIEKVGYLPDEYFMYYEDVDFCMMVKNEGYKLMIALDSVIYHKVSSSTGGEQSPFSIQWGTRNRLIFMEKYKEYTEGIDTKLFFYITRLIKILEYTLKGDKERKNAITEGIKEGRKYLKKDM